MRVDLTVANLLEATIEPQRWKWGKEMSETWMKVKKKQSSIEAKTNSLSQKHKIRYLGIWHDDDNEVLYYYYHLMASLSALTFPLHLPARSPESSRPSQQERASGP